MKKGLILLTSLFLLAGCALPLPLKVASWALDGISYLATNKSIAENGLSIIAKKDCSLMRPLKGQPVCVGNNYDIAQVLKNAVTSSAVDDVDDRGVQVQALAEFETAAGPAPDKLSYDASEFSDAWRFMRQQVGQVKQAKQAEQVEPEHIAKAATPPVAAIGAIDATDPPGYDANENTEAWAFIQARNGGLANTMTREAVAEVEEKPAITPAPASITRSMARAPLAGPDAQPSAGLYYVIGSLTRLINLDRLAQRQTDLESLVVVAQVRDRPIYREVVGPFKRSEKQTIRRMIEKAGVTKAWLTFIDPHRWTLASPAEISVLTLGGAQTASLR